MSFGIPLVSLDVRFFSKYKFIHIITEYKVVDMRQVELACGRDGLKPRELALEKLKPWSATSSARRAVLHAIEIYNLIKGAPLGEELPPHLLCSAFQVCEFDLIYCHADAILISDVEKGMILYVYTQCMDFSPVIVPSTGISWLEYLKHLNHPALPLPVSPALSFVFKNVQPASHQGSKTSRILTELEKFLPRISTGKLGEKIFQMCKSVRDLGDELSLRDSGTFGEQVAQYGETLARRDGVLP